MPVRKYKPTTPGRRGMSVDTFEFITATKPEKSLIAPRKQKSGRNNQGRITVRHRGGGAKRNYRIVDAKRFDKLDIPAVVKTIEYDPNRTAYIALLFYADGEKRYIIAPHTLKVGDRIVCSVKAKVKTGNRMQLKSIPVGFNIHDLELKSGRGAQAIRSAGSSGKIAALEGEMAQVTLPSGSVRYVSKECYATIGVVSNIDYSNIKIGKAGRVRWMGKRPQVLGKSMNAVDHPHGGGEGHNSIGLKYPKTPWGKPALGVSTRRHRHSDHLIIKGRHKKKR
ncbi:50S ribosomal protein L2 [Candidatus Peregrinibacteria bacterium CG_4_10_14_0_2_um_filter_43_11]|nr:MAG: 50S ribosomal protein L2 [Candidatus Peregrinibacteria bacterium CG_4_10_14_0_2_um_filter_43_11]